MELKDTLFTHPEAIFMGCVAWIILAVWIYSLIIWMIQGDLDVIPGIVGAMLGVALGWTAMRPPSPALEPLIFFAILGTAVLFPFLRGALAKRELSQVDVEAIERSYIALGDRPTNAALRFKLARTIHNRGMTRQAIAIGREVIGQLPRQYFADEHRALRQWIESTSEQGPTTTPCMDCGFQNQMNDIFCQKCGARYLIPHAQGKWLAPSFAKRMLSIWILLILLGIGIPLSVSALVAPYSFIVLLFLIIGGTYGVVNAFVSQGTAS